MELQERIRADLTKQEERTGFSLSRLLAWWGLSRSTFYGWTAELRTANRYNPAAILAEEESAVVEFRRQHKEVGYRKLTWLMNDAGVLS